MDFHEKQQLISEWYQWYADDIYKLIVMMMGDQQQAEDLTHDTFVKAFQHLDGYRGEAQPKTWLVKIARNLTIDYLRKKKPIQTMLELFTNRPTHAPSPSEIVTSMENKQEILLALQSLNRSYREVIILRKIQAFSTKETAHILGWSESKVKVTLHRALKSLKATLQKGGFAHERTL